VCLESSPVSEVFIRFNDIGKDGCDGLAAVVNLSHTLQVLDIRGNHLSASDVRRLLKSVAVSTVLTRLGLGANKLGPEGAALITKALERNTYLTSLDLSVNELGQGGAECLAGLLRTPETTLQVLQLHGNYFGASGVAAICEAVKTNKELRRLTIGNNHATDEAAAAIAAMLEGNYTLEDLDLRLNSLTAVGVKTIAQHGLAKNTSLRFLTLSGNQVGPVGANELTHVLSAHQRSVIEQLDLSSCGLMSTGGVRIASLLSTSISLKDVNLSDNGLDDEAAVSLAQNIADGFAISVVDVSCNEIGEEGASHLIDAALRNAQLSALVMHGNNISRVAQKKMDNLLEQQLSKNRVLNRHTALYQQQKLTQQQQQVSHTNTGTAAALVTS
jgi:Ran GTPase-activating protein (RanGAP) involved in mRNA processing and transport